MSGHHLVTDVSMVIFAPAMAAVTLVVGNEITGVDTSNQEASILVMALAIGMFLFNGFSIFKYLVNIPADIYVDPKPLSEEAPVSPAESTTCCSLFMSVVKGAKWPNL